jgi:hypothetical protein
MKTDELEQKANNIEGSMLLPDKQVFIMLLFKGSE